MTTCIFCLHHLLACNPAAQWGYATRKKGLIPSNQEKANKAASLSV
jgi:hypothetical protein